MVTDWLCSCSPIVVETVFKYGSVWALFKTLTKVVVIEQHALYVFLDALAVAAN